MGEKKSHEKKKKKQQIHTACISSENERVWNEPLPWS